MAAGDGQFMDDAGRALVPSEDARVLVIGAGGMLGRAMTATLSAHGVNWVGTGRGTLDLGDPSSLRREADDWIPRDGVVINCAAWTDVDGAEKDEAGALAVNGTGPGLLAALCRDRGAVLAHFSTDYVFDGQGESREYRSERDERTASGRGEQPAVGPAPRPEGGRALPGASAPGEGVSALSPGGRAIGGLAGEVARPPGERSTSAGPGAEAPGNPHSPSGRDAVGAERLSASEGRDSRGAGWGGRSLRPWRIEDSIAAINAYGRTKAAGERAIVESGCEHLIIRTSWLHAAWGKNFVRTIAGLCMNRPQIRVVDDQVGRPTCCWHLASATLALLRRGGRGVFHVTDGGAETSWCAFAREIAGHVGRRWGRTCEVVPCSTADFPRPAKRPAYSVLDLSRAESLIGARPDWRVGLAEVMATMERPV